MILGEHWLAEKAGDVSLECVMHGAFIFHVSASILCLLSIVVDRVLY